MKIIVLGTRGFPNIQGGIEKHCEELYPRLAALGCDVTVIGRAPYTGPTPYKHQGVAILPLACLKNKFLETFLHTFLGVLIAKQLKGDILHIHAIGPSLFVPLARMLGMKVVMTHHGPDYERKKWNRVKLAKLILKLGEKWGALYANKVIVITNYIAETLRRNFGCVAAVIPNGVVVSRRSSEIEILKRFHLDQGKYILTVGRFVPEKGFIELVESFHKFYSNEQGMCKLVIVGDADHEDEYSRELKKISGDTPRVVLTGFQSGKSLQELYSHAGLFVLPSFHEGLPIVLLEALSYGSSCLVSDIPANREVNLEEERYFKPGDIDGMARKIREFVDQPPTEEQRKQRIQQIMIKYNWTKIARKTLHVYETVLDRQKLKSKISFKKPISDVFQNFKSQSSQNMLSAKTNSP